MTVEQGVMRWAAPFIMGALAFLACCILAGWKYISRISIHLLAAAICAAAAAAIAWYGVANFYTVWLAHWCPVFAIGLWLMSLTFVFRWLDLRERKKRRAK